MATYSIIGAGSSSGNPVTVFAGCEETVNICWTGRIEVDGYCSECTYYDDQYCDSVSGVTESTTGTISWSGGTSVHYEIIKSCVPEPVPQPCSSYTCSDFSLYTVPSYIDLVNPPTNIDIHYSYLVTYKDDDGHICGREELSNVDSIDFDDFKPSGDTKYVYSFAPLSDACSATSGVATVYVLSDEDTCDSGVTVDVTTSFSPSVVPALPSSGTDVTVNIMCRKVEVSKDCTKKITNTGNTLVWHVKCCTDCSENSGCCTDHTVSSAFTMEYIRDLAGVDEDAVIRYNGVKATSEIPFSIVQKGKDTEECSASTEDKVTKYCVDSESVKVEYETSYMSNRWSETGIVPFSGGRIRVSWNYSACTDSLCSTNTWQEIIDISSCDDRDGGTDTECSYEQGDDGKITGTCVIYFKEQTDDCECPGENPYDPESETGKYNKITYSFEQDCASTCESYTSIVYGNIDAETGNINKVSAYTSSPCVEDSGEDIEINNIPYSSTTEYIGLLCPERDITTGITSTTVHITSDNNSDSERIIFENDMVCVIQPAGPCSSDTQCGVAVELKSGLEGTDTAFLGFTDSEGTAQYNASNGDIIEYYYNQTPENENVSITIEFDPDNNEDYRYKFTDGTEYITGFELGCGESASTVAVKYCGCKKLKGITGETAITADGGDSITVAIYSVTCDSLNLEVKHVSGDEVLDLSVAPVFNSDSTLTAKVSENTSSTSERTGNYVVRNSLTHIDCLKGRFTVKQEKKVLPECNIEWLSDEECVTCDCSMDDFILNTTSLSISKEGYDDRIGTVGDCIDKENMYITATTSLWSGVRLYYDENNSIYLVVPENDDSAREETIEITYSATCGEAEAIWEKTLILIQDGDGCGCGSITYEGDEEPDPTPTIEKLKIKIQIKNTTNTIVYWDEIGLEFSDGSEENPETCDSCPANSTVFWHYGGTASQDDYIELTHYSSTDTPTITGAMMSVTNSNCNNTGSATLSVAQTTLHDGDTILLTYNGND